MTTSLILDTETTGLLDFNLPLEHSDQPDIIQFCGWMDLDGKIVSKINIFVHGEKPVEERAYETHRISRDLTGAVGVSRRRMCMIVDDLVKRADLIVGHNIEFDLKMLLLSMRREQGDGRNLSSTATYCTMKNSVEACKIPNPKRPGQYKWPSLKEAYEKLVDPRGFENAHDAEADVKACYELFKVLRTKTV